MRKLKQGIDEKSKQKKEQSLSKWLKSEMRIKDLRPQKQVYLDIMEDQKTLMKTTKELEDRLILAFGVKQRKELLKSDSKNNAPSCVSLSPIWFYQCFWCFGYSSCHAWGQQSCILLSLTAWRRKVNGFTFSIGIQPGFILFQNAFTLLMSIDALLLYALY